jgi:nucleoid-associated protein YgaU
MFFKGSRYEGSRPFTPYSGGREVFPGVRPREVVTRAGAVEHVVRAGDRLDLLARHYYNDDRLWWRIVDANPEALFAGDMLAPGTEGQVILIPAGRG